MALIELYISKSCRGYSSIANVNPTDEHACHVHDFRAALETVEYDRSIPHFFYLVSFLEQGMLFSVIRTFAGVTTDHYSATMFLPARADMLTTDFEELLSSVSGVIDTEGDISSEKIAGLRRIFSKNYSLAAERPMRTPSFGRTYAFARFDGHGVPSFAQYLNHRFYQPEYSAHAGVLLVPESAKVKASKGAVDLTKPALVDMAVLLPPTGELKGFKPFVNKREFVKPVLVPRNSQVVVEWRRPGFAVLSQKVNMDSDRVTTPVPDTSSTVKTISPTMFFITESSTSQTIGAALITVNGVEIDEPKDFKCSELTDAKVDISAPGYFALSTRMDLAATSRALLQMRPLHKNYRFDLPLITPEPVEAMHMYVKTRKPLRRCPVEGYEVAGGEIVEGSGVSNHLVYVGGASRSRRRRLIIFTAAAFIAGMLVGALAFGSSSRKVHSTPHELPKGTPVEASAASVAEDREPAPVAEPAIDYSAACKYLDDNKNWNRDEMENVPGLQGLFEDLNDYNFQRINEYWQPLLAQSANFTAIVRAVDGAASKRNPRTGIHTPKFNRDDDSNINWRSYTYWIDP